MKKGTEVFYYNRDYFLEVDTTANKKCTCDTTTVDFVLTVYRSNLVF